MENQSNATIKVTLLERIRFELHKLSQSSDNIKTWITIVLFLMGVSIMFKSWLFFIIYSGFLLYLISEKHVQSGAVTNWKRRQSGIPTKSEIKNMKENYKMEQSNGE